MLSRIFLIFGIICLAEAGPAIDGSETVAEFCGRAPVIVPPATEERQSFIGEVQYIPITDGIIAYYRFGNVSIDERPPLILIAGYGSTMGDWNAELLEVLASHQEIIIFDNRGMGESEDYTITRMTVRSMAEDTAEFVQGLELGVKPNLLGVSLGGFIALASAGLYGDLYDNVIIIAGSAGSPNSSPPPPESRLAFSPNSSPLLRLGSFYPLQYPDAAKTACRVYFDPGNVAPAIVNQTTFNRQSVAVLDFFYARTDIWDAIPGIQNNLLLIGGENDAIVPIQGLQKIAERSQNPWLVIFKKAGHGVLQQYSWAIVDLVETFLTWASND